MVKYPGLSELQQRNLPTLLKPAEQLSAKFEDSTHQLWYCETSDGPMVLKLCNYSTIESSPFWQGMNRLFAIDFPASLAHIDQIHQFLSEKSFLNIPEYISSQDSSYVLARFLDGDDVDYNAVSNLMVKQLARHIAQLHLYQQSSWGAFQHADFSARQWSQRLQQTLVTLAKGHPTPISDTILEHAIEQVNKLKINDFSPIMLDLRWDQMLHQQGQLSAIVDMDAFVIGPKELELVLLEYQLTQQQADCFARSYQEFAELPVLSEQRYAYRLLLFLMNSLGETDLEKWMSAPIWWQ